MIEDFTNILNKMIVGVLEKHVKSLNVHPVSVSTFVLKNYIKGPTQRALSTESDDWDIG